VTTGLRTRPLGPELPGVAVIVGHFAVGRHAGNAQQRQGRQIGVCEGAERIRETRGEPGVGFALAFCRWQRQPGGVHLPVDRLGTQAKKRLAELIPAAVAEDQEAG